MRNTHSTPRLHTACRNSESCSLRIQYRPQSTARHNPTRPILPFPPNSPSSPYSNELHHISKTVLRNPNAFRNFPNFESWLTIQRVRDPIRRILSSFPIPPSRFTPIPRRNTRRSMYTRNPTRASRFMERFMGLGLPNRHQQSMPIRSHCPRIDIPSRSRGVLHRGAYYYATNPF